MSGFIQKVREAKGKPLPVPVGSAAVGGGSGPSALAEWGATANPDSACPATVYCTPTKNLCAGYSLAAAMTFYGDDAAAKAIQEHSKAAWQSGDALLYLLQEVGSARVCGWQARWAKAHEKKVLDLTFVTRAEPMLLQISPEHSVTLVGEWIFDANFDHKLPAGNVTQRKESLEKAMWRATKGSFSHVSRAVLLEAGTSVKKHVKRKRHASGSA